MISIDIRRLALSLTIVCTGLGCVEETSEEARRSIATDCAQEHATCSGGNFECVEFGESAGLAFTGYFVPECFEDDAACDGGESCVGDFACGSDAACPGLCVEPICEASN